MLGLSNILMNTQGECPCLYVASSYHKLFAAPLALISTAKLRCQALFRLNNIVVALVVMTVFFDHMFKAEVRYINIHIYSYIYIYIGLLLLYIYIYNMCVCNHSIFNIFRFLARFFFIMCFLLRTECIT